MVRISDILKKKMQEKQQPLAQAGAQAHKEEKPQEEMRVAKAMKEIQPDIEKVRQLYVYTLRLVKGLFIELQKGRALELKPIRDAVKEVVDLFVLGDNTLLTLVSEDYSGDDYPYQHMVNVMIMSVMLGLQLEYNKSRLNELGLAAILHDIGMSKYRDMVIEPRSLSEEEYSLIKEHPSIGSQELGSSEGITETIIAAIKEHHERFNGQGYPSGTKNADISEFARIIATLDVYEALTHSRNYRQKKFSPHEAIKEILADSASCADPDILKAFINLIGIYPVGSWVELNTNEIARVITSNANFPIRPVINILFDAHRKRLSQPRLVNLAKQFNIYIKKPLSEEEVSELAKE